MSAQQVNVLMVEDLKIAQITAYNLFKKLNCKITIATNSARALDLIIQKHFDIIFSDLQLPDMEGYELASTIRSIQKHHLPLIAVTANSFPELAERTRASGFDDYLLKPLTLESVRMMLFKYLRDSDTDLLNRVAA